VQNIPLLMGVLEVKGLRIEYSFHKPKNFNGKAVFLLPGVSGGALSSRFSFLLKPFQEKGYATLKADIWENRKEFLKLSAEQIFSSLDEIISFLKKEGCKEINAVGKSLGGGLLLMYGNKEIKNMYLFAPTIGLAEETKPATLKKKFKEFPTIESIRVGKKNLKEINSKVYVFQGNQDKTVPMEEAKELSYHIEGCEFMVLEGASHSYKTDVEQNTIKLFLEKLLS
jgi:esterase/lipase